MSKKDATDGESIDLRYVIRGAIGPAEELLGRLRQLNDSGLSHGRIRSKYVDELVELESKLDRILTAYAKLKD